MLIGSDEMARKRTRVGRADPTNDWGLTSLPLVRPRGGWYVSNSAYPTNRTAWKYSIEPRGIGPVSIASALEDVRASYTLPIDRRVAEQSL